VGVKLDLFKGRMSGNKVLRRIFGHKMRKWRETREECIMRSFNNCTFHQKLYGYKSRGLRWAKYVANTKRDEKCTQYFGWKP
jgi:hypothetical protein